MKTRNPGKGFAEEQPSSRTLGIRFLIEDPVRGWRVLSAKRAFAAQRGELLMPDLANRAIRVAYADVAVRNSRPVALYSLEITEWHVDAEGRIDQSALVSRIIEKLDQSEPTPPDKCAFQPSQADYDAICSALRFPPSH